MRLYINKTVYSEYDKCRPGEGGVDAVDKTVVHYGQDSHTPSINNVA